MEVLIICGLILEHWAGKSEHYSVPAPTAVKATELQQQRQLLICPFVSFSPWKCIFFLGRAGDQLYTAMQHALQSCFKFKFLDIQQPANVAVQR